MNATAPTLSARALVFARHIVGMMIVALGYTEIYSFPRPVLGWLVTWFMPLLFAATLAGLYLLFFTEHAKARWGKTLITIAWITLLLIVTSPWLEAINQKERDRELLLKFRESQAQSAQPKDSNSEPQTPSEKWWEQFPRADQHPSK